MAGRALLAFLLLPGIVAGLVPLWLGWPAGRFRGIGLVPLIPGLALLLWCVREFSVTGQGTLAPWDPPRHLVAVGPYRVSRNPMYVAVILTLIGWALAFASMTNVLYALIVGVAFHLRVRFHEEPYLRRTHGEAWTQYSAQVPRWLFRNRRAVVLAWLIALIALPVIGRSYQTWAERRDARAFRPPGRLVDIGGRRLHLVCLGRGAPIVLFEAASWQTALSSTRARERLAEETMVCSYDRSGMGFSDAVTSDAVSIGDLARDLATLQDRAPLPGPLVIVASSIGGLTAEMFARRYPERVAGLVFLDAGSSIGIARHTSLLSWAKPAACTVSLVASFGVIRMLDPLAFDREGSDASRRSAALVYNTKPWRQFCAIARALPTTVQEFTAAPPLRGDVPLVVLSAANRHDLLPPLFRGFVDLSGQNPAMTASHQQLAHLSTRGRWMEVPQSTHLIASSQPDVVVAVVHQILSTTR